MIENLEQAVKIRQLESNLVIRKEIEVCLSYKSMHKLDPNEYQLRHLVKQGLLFPLTYQVI